MKSNVKIKMKRRTSLKLQYKAYSITVLIIILILPIANFIPNNLYPSDSSNKPKTQADDSGEDSILWKLGKGLPGSGATMQPRLVNLTEGGPPLIVVGTDGGLAAITLDGFINMSYRTFGPVIDFEIIEDISGDNLDDIVLITYFQEHPNLIAISSNNGSEIWKYKTTIEGISAETYQAQKFIPYSWDIKLINDITSDDIPEIVISSWYRLIAINGKSGNKVWMNDHDFTNDVWKLEVVEDINGNGFETIIAGSEEGKLCAFDSQDGSKLWTFTVEGTQVITYSVTGLTLVTVPNSIDDIKVVGDVNNDEISDLLIASDDGYLRLISGRNRQLLDENVCYNISETTETLYDRSLTSPYSSLKRIFMKSGIKIYETPDINNDGIKEYISIASDLDYSSNSQDKIIQGRIFNIIDPLSEINKINITYSLNWTYNSFFLSSYPEIIKVDSDIYIYYYSYESRSYTAKINRYNINDKKSENPEVVYTDLGQYESVSRRSGSEKGHYFLNVGDLNSDGVDDLFAFTANGRYLCIDCKNNDILWVRTQEASEIEITEINDLNGDGFKDFLIMQKSDFEPDWISSETSSQTTEKPTIIVELYTIDARTGNIIWSLNIPSPEYYNGLRDLKHMGDITGDDTDDYGAWIIPSIIPSDVSEIIKNLIGNGTIDPYKAEAIYRSLLTKYTKVLVIDGSDGSIIWNTPMIDFPYKFYREFEYNGTYLDPVDGSSSGKDIYNRINGEIDNTWINSSFNIQWDGEGGDPWNTSSLAQASSIDLINGTSSDLLSDLLSDEGNYTINAEYVDSSWKAIMDLTIPVNLLDDGLLGGMDYPLSQIERLSALKMQTSLMVNTSSSSWYNFTYEIFDISNNKWVLCNWSSEPKTWNNHTYPDLKGDFESTRTSFNYFPLHNNSFQDDQMWVITRGTHDADYFIEFDYENKTTLSNFVDVNKNIQIRLNITNDNSAFNLTINDFGLAAFYWGLFDNEYDRYYMWKYASDEYSEDEFDVSNLLNLEIQDFEVINGNNDQYLDLIAVIGFENYDTPNTWSTRIRLFDLKNNMAYTKWSLNQTLLPYQNVRVLPLNNSLNNWLLTGIFQFGSNFNCSHKLISDPYWDSQISHFESYSDSQVLISYSWEIIPNFPAELYIGSIPYEFPGKTNISKDGKIGIIVGEYGYLEYEWYQGQEGSFYSSFINIRIIDISSGSTVCKIPTENLRSAKGYSDESIIGKIDFGIEGAGYLLLISHEDFNGDDFLDHVGIYYIYEYSEDHYMHGMECKIFSGNSSDSNPDLIFKEYFADVSINDNTYLSDKLKMPFASIGDINNDGTSEAIIGIQSEIHSSSACKHSYINFYDIFNSNENEPIELTNYKWVLESASCLNPYYSYYNYEFILNVEKIEDINGDGYNEIFIEHDYYRKTTDDYNTELYEKIPTSEIMDIFNQTILYRFNMELNSIHPIVDLNEDGSKELLIASGELVYCINSKFNIQILNPKNSESMISNNFNIEWETDSQYDSFEVLINGVSQGYTTAKNIQVSLSSGWKDISVIMTDKSGLILSVNTIKVLVPSNQIHLILTFVLIGALVGVYIYYRRYSKKQKELILIDKKISEGGKK